MIGLTREKAEDARPLVCPLLASFALSFGGQINHFQPQPAFKGRVSFGFRLKMGPRPLLIPRVKNGSQLDPAQMRMVRNWVIPETC